MISDKSVYKLLLLLESLYGVFPRERLPSYNDPVTGTRVLLIFRKHKFGQTSVRFP